MAQQYFNVEKGYQIGNSVRLSGSGIPGSAGDSTTVAIGSIYTDEATGYIYMKMVAGAGTGNWTRVALISDVSTPPEVGYIDTYLGKTAGSNLPTYSSTNYVSNSATVVTSIGTLDSSLKTVSNSQTSTNTEVGYLDTYVGKTAGNNTPTYSSTNYVTNGNGLVTAIGALDSNLKTQANNIVTLQTTSTDNAKHTLTSGSFVSGLVVDSLNVGTGNNAMMAVFDVLVVDGTNATRETIDLQYAYSSVDFNAYGILKTGSGVSFTVSAAYNSGTKAVDVTVTSATATKVVVKRCSLDYFSI